MLVRTVATGVCHSDLHFVEGLWPHPTPAVLGHEAAGIVERVGSEVTYLKPGDHVISCPSVFCGRCKQCNVGPSEPMHQPPPRSGAPRATSRASRKDGEMIRQFSDLSTYAEKMLLHENALVKIRDDMPLDRAALIGCGVTTGVGAALNTAKVEPGSTVAVFGAGGVGLSAIQGARIAGAAMIIAVDMFEHKLATAKRFGATHTVDASSTDPVEAIQKLTDGGVDYSFEAIGLKKAAEQCFRRARARRHRDRHRHDPGGAEGRNRRPQVADRAADPGLADGLEPLPHRHAAVHRFLPAGAAQPRRHDPRRGKLEDVNEAFRAMKAGEVSRTVLMFD